MDTAQKKEKQRTGKGSAPVEIFRSGAVAASIWKRQTPTGFEYLDFSLSRSWKMKNGEKEGYSNSFFERNEAALLDVVRRACAYIRDHQNTTMAAVHGRNAQGATSAATEA